MGLVIFIVTALGLGFRAQGLEPRVQVAHGGRLRVHRWP